MAQKITHWINVPHEGPSEFEFDFTSVTFSDGIPRAICTSRAVPDTYWPTAVYALTPPSAPPSAPPQYTPVGTYRLDNTRTPVFISHAPQATPATPATPAS